MKQKLKRNPFVRYCYYSLMAFLALVKLPFLKHPEAMQRYKGIHKGERCFIVSTGPSLTVGDIEALRNEITFSMNSIVKSFGITDWRPTYYVVSDRIPFEACKSLINHEDFEMTFYRCGIDNANSNVCHFVADNTGYYNCLRKNKFKGKLFPSKRLERYFNNAPSVVFSIVQLAIYMGFSEIYLLGQDCNFANASHASFAASKYRVLPTDADARKILDTFNNYEIALSNTGVSIYNVTRGGNLDLFVRKELNDVLGTRTVLEVGRE